MQEQLAALAQKTAHLSPLPTCLEEPEREETEEDQNSSAILEESTAKILPIHKTVNLFEKKKNAPLPLAGQLQRLVEHIAYPFGPN